MKRIINILSISHDEPKKICKCKPTNPRGQVLRIVLSI